MTSSATSSATSGATSGARLPAQQPAMEPAQQPAMEPAMEPAAAAARPAGSAVSLGGTVSRPGGTAPASAGSGSRPGDQSSRPVGAQPWPGDAVPWPGAMLPWPADLAHAYRVAGCWQGRPLGSYLWEWADRWPQRVALVDGTTRLTFLDLATRADALADGLASLGLGRGDVVLVQLPNCWEFVVAVLACARLGVAPVLMLPAHREYELASIGTHVRAKALIVPGSWRGYDHQDLAHRVAAALPAPAQVLVLGGEPRPGSVGLRELLRQPGDPVARRQRLDGRSPAAADVALFLLSGGTTGVPKVIGRTHESYEYGIRRCSQVCGFGPDTVYLAVLPAGHNFPLGSPGILGALQAGGRAVLLPSPRPDAVLEAIETQRVTVTSAVPAVVRTWLAEAADRPRDLSSLRCVQVGGSVLAPELARQVGPVLGCRLQQVYGMAEGLICVTPADAPDEVALTTQGAPVSPYDELLVVGPDGHQVPPGEIGELLTRGPCTPRGYYGLPARSSAAFTADGWYRTGDLVRITAEGYTVVCGRATDMINRAGEKILPGEIEALVQELPQVAEAAVVAMPAPDVGERACLFVRLHPGQALTLGDIRAALTTRGVAAFKIPERLEVLDDLPRTPVGKPDKKALRDLARIPPTPPSLPDQSRPGGLPGAIPE